MKKLYLITGGTGHLGTILVSSLLSKNDHVRVLVLPGHEHLVPDGVEIAVGDVSRRESLISFFNRDGYDRVTLIHCAALITISTRQNPQVWHVNTCGTENVMRLALETGVERVIYVSSVHAIPEKPKAEVITYGCLSYVTAGGPSPHDSASLNV